LKLFQWESAGTDEVHLLSLFLSYGGYFAWRLRSVDFPSSSVLFATAICLLFTLPLWLLMFIGYRNVASAVRQLGTLALSLIPLYVIDWIWSSL